MASRRPALPLLVLVLGLATGAGAASFPPGLRFRSLETRRVVVHYHQDLEGTARLAAAMATEILEAHESRYQIHVGPKVHIVLADNQDSPNGFATPLPYPLVSVRAAAPDGSDDFGNYEGWLRFVLTHELAHVVHLEPAAGLSGFGRKVLGRAPFLFFNALTPTWMIEGLATYEETEGTSFGRGRNADSRMVLRMAALEGKFLHEDEPVLGLDEWPAGLGSYLAGESFLRDLTSRSGKDTLPRLARDNVRHPIPYLDELTSSHVTGSSFHTWWREWSFESRARFQEEAKRLQALGLTPSRAITSRGIRQNEPRFSPDGRRIAYTSRTNTRYTAIRLVGADGKGDKRLVDRNGGRALSWTPDGKSLVYDEPDTYRFFSVRSDLRRVDAATGRSRRITRGLRAREPDVSRDGRIVFVRRFPDRAELSVVGLDGEGLRQVTRSVTGTEWNSPHWSPDGTFLVASRWTAPGWLDLVRVDPESGEVAELTHDRAKDVEPSFTPDGGHVVFRSDRDGISNLYALRLADAAVLRVTRVLGGAFDPEVSPDGRSVAFASYGSQGYDVRVMDLDLQALEPAEAFVDPYPPARDDPAPVAAADRPYRPLPTMLPRFWAPYASHGSEEWKVGAATAGADPLVRHAYGLDVHVGVESGRVGYRGYYQYDRFRPNFVLSLEDKTDLVAGGQLDRTRQGELQVGFPLTRSFRSSQSLGLAYRFRRDEVVNGGARPQDLGAIELSWSRNSSRSYPYSISPVDGWRLRLAWAREDPAFGSDVSLSKFNGDARAYVRIGEGHALAFHAAGGGTVGQPGFPGSFAVGGFPDSGLFDVVRTNVSVLRGYPDDAFTGRSFLNANAEWRFPLAHPQRGWRSFPAFVRHVSGTLFADLGAAWTGDLRRQDLKTAVGAALGLDVNVSQVLPLSLSTGVARGFDHGGATRVYFRLGLAF